MEGNTKIEAKEGKITIDLKNSSVKKIIFRGVQLSEDNAEDIMTKIAQNCNEKIMPYYKNHLIKVYENGFWIFKDYSTKNKEYNVSRKEQNLIRDLTVIYKIGIDDKPIIMYKNAMTFTKIGIYIPVYKRKIITKSAEILFIPYKELFNYEFGCEDSDVTIKSQLSHETWKMECEYYNGIMAFEVSEAINKLKISMLK